MPIGLSCRRVVNVFRATAGLAGSCDFLPVVVGRASLRASRGRSTIENGPILVRRATAASEMRPPSERDSVVRLFDSIRSSHPGVQMDLASDVSHDWVDVEMRIAAQPGRPFAILLQLQRDELHLYAGDAFHASWFPCTSSEVVEQFRTGVEELLAGRWRVVEYIIRHAAVRAQLQRPTADGWRPVATWANPLALIPWPRRERILQAHDRKGAA